MLFSSIVFMSRTLRGQWTTIVLVFVLKLNIASTAQIKHENVMRFSGDFEGFLKDLGSMVYKSKKSVMSGNDVRSHHERLYTTPPHKTYRRSQNIYNTQKAALGDVLMMKLVSYYEDKYKLTHLEPTTTESITFMDTFTSNANKYSVDLVDYRQQQQQHQQVQQQQQQQQQQKLTNNNQLIEKQRQQTQARVERNRRMDVNIRRSYDEPIPEVVIL